MAYQYKPDHLKKCNGRPRKYESGYTERISKPNRKSRQQTAEELRGVAVVQLDYLTGEYVGEYPSYTACSDDLDIPIATILGSFAEKNGYCCIARMPKYETLLIKKVAFNALMDSIQS